MAISPGSRRSDTRSTVSGEPDPTPLNPMQEPLGSTERPVYRTSDDNDVNLSSDGTRRTGNLGTLGGRSRGITTTFAIIAAVLVAVFLIALFMGVDGINEATAPVGTQPPVAEVPGTTDDTTGSTTTPPPAPAQESAPATGNTDTGTTTPPANP